MEQRNKVRGVDTDRDVAQLTFVSVPDRPGVARSVFAPFAAAGIIVDVIVQNVGHDGTTDLSFTVARSDLARARRLLKPLVAEIGARDVSVDDSIAKVSIVGAGVQNAPAYAAQMFGALADEGINIALISTSEVRITCLIEESQLERAARALRRAFDLEVPEPGFPSPFPGRSERGPALGRSEHERQRRPFRAASPKSGTVGHASHRSVPVLIGVPIRRRRCRTVGRSRPSALAPNGRLRHTARCTAPPEPGGQPVGPGCGAGQSAAHRADWQRSTQASASRNHRGAANHPGARSQPAAPRPLWTDCGCPAHAKAHHPDVASRPRIACGRERDARRRGGDVAGMLSRAAGRSCSVA